MRIEDAALELAPADGARRVVGGLLDEAVGAARALAAGTGEEPLHDFRVAVRRLRGALRAFRPWLRPALRREHERRLKRIARSTGGARDAEVQLAWLAARRAEVSSPSHLPGHAAAVARFEALRDAAPAPAKVARRLRRAARKVRRGLDGSAAGREDGAAARAEGTFAAALAGLVTEQVAALADRIAEIRDAADVEAAHRARIQAKRLRDLVGPLRGSRRADASEVARALKRLQDLLGDLHDAHVLAAELGDALADAAASRARRVHAALLSTGPRRLRDGLRESPRPGLLALLRLVRARRDAVFAALEAAWRAGAVETLAAQARVLAEALAGQPPAPGAVARPAARARPRPTRSPRRGSSGGGRPSRAP
jgi:CHAD domain-containing protein